VNLPAIIAMSSNQV